jgi:hypothetical protein
MQSLKVFDVELIVRYSVAVILQAGSQKDHIPYILLYIKTIAHII